MITVLIPAFNEERAVATVIAGIPGVIAGHRTAIVVIDDGSTDATAAEARRGGAEVVRLDANRGKGAAMRCGRERAAALSADVVVAIDADGQHDPACLPELVAPVAAGTHDMVIGSRYLADPRRGATPLNRYVVRNLTCSYLSKQLNLDLTDPYSGLRAYNRRVLEEMHLVGPGYQSELELLFEAAIHGWRIREIPIPRLYPPHSSKMGARGGRLIGRIRVLAGYAATTIRKRRELRVVRQASSHNHV
jgi:glycosyltransferase involved in cell wall biosynthesis